MRIYQSSVPRAEAVARQVGKEVAKEVEQIITEKANQWISENKLIHAGAALKLAKFLSESYPSKENK